jgi:hypothetical protein
MMRKLIQYRTAENRADENEALIRNVFEDLEAKTPSGLRYLALNLGGGHFVHFVETDENEGGGLLQLETFRQFQRDLKDRQVEPTVASNAAVIGDYRMLGK